MIILTESSYFTASDGRPCMKKESSSLTNVSLETLFLYGVQTSVSIRTSAPTGTDPTFLLHFVFVTHDGVLDLESLFHNIFETTAIL